jgi:hypothetical protein
MTFCVSFSRAIAGVPRLLSRRHNRAMLSADGMAESIFVASIHLDHFGLVLWTGE